MSKIVDVSQIWQDGHEKANLVTLVIVNVFLSDTNVAAFTESKNKIIAHEKC
jgi:hypothetical protein